MRHTVPKGFCALLLLLLSSSGFGWAKDRIVAIGDVHGSYPQFVSILRRVGLIDDRRQWIGGSAVLVQIGDVPSRGTRTRDCLDLLMDLEEQAKKQKGRVIPLLGNHETMVMTGDVRYMRPEDLRTFATEHSETVREQAFEEYKAYLAGRLQRRGASLTRAEVDRKKWMEEHPLGFFEFRDAFGPRSKYGRWWRQHDALAQVNGVLFLHGGLSPDLQFQDIGELNKRVRSELALFDSLWESLSRRGIIWRYMRQEEAWRAVQEEWEARDPLKREGDADEEQELRALLSFPGWLIASPQGPLWYRGYAMEPEEKLAPTIEAHLSRLKVQRIVAAHTITDSRRIISRFQNRVFLIDTAMMLEEKGQGRTSALEINSGSFTAYYSSGEKVRLLSARDTP